MLNFSQNVNEKKLKDWKFQSLNRRGSFSAIKKTAEERRG